MNLQHVTIQGFRRFVKPSSIRLNGRLVAFVGPNEAGKSSILSALEQAGTDKAFDAKDRPRRRNETIEIVLTYLVTPADRQAMAAITGAAALRRCKITKKMNGQPVIELEPTPVHDLSPRKKLLEELKSTSTSTLLQGFGNHDERANRIHRLKSAIGELTSQADYLGDNAWGHLNNLLNADLRPLQNDPRSNEESRSRATQLADQLESLIQFEQSAPPEAIRRTLLRRRPPVLMFDGPSRELAHTYDLAAYSTNPPPALRNLARLCDLDLPALFKASSNKDIPHRDEILERANGLLLKKFSASWVRKGVVPQLSQDGHLLYINIRTGDEGGLSPITDRSDGFRWFVALIAFLCGRESEEAPILLVDEAETHLSYDAQASLVDVLETQKVAQKVIYTTHSAGCLPSDLGTGVRSIVPLKGEQSEVSNNFWHHRAGFSPLLMSMGLSPFAFTVARNVLIAEGPSECFLLPSLLREATGELQLHYQVAPGASIVARAGVDELMSQSERGAFVLDGDDGGQDIKDKLKAAGVEEKRIRTFRDSSGCNLTFEDLISPEEYAKAYNGELQFWTPGAPSLTVADFGELDRANSVEAWCIAKDLKPVGKVYVSQALAEMAAEGARIVRPECREILVQLHAWASEHFTIKPADSARA